MRARSLTAALLITAVVATPASGSFLGLPGAIAFSRSGEHPGIRIMARDGSDTRRLTRGADGGAAWAPDGSRIAFLRWRSDGSMKIIVMNADGSSRQLVSEPSLGLQSGCGLQPPKWSYDGAWILYADDCFDREPRVAQLRLAAADGSSHLDLTDYAAMNHAGMQPWSGDSSRLTFTRSGDLYTIDADGTNETRLTDDEAEQLEPAWSPSADTIAFVTQSTTAAGDPHGVIEGITPQATERRVLFEGRYAVGQILWSPDGTMIAFTRYALYGFPTALILDADDLTIRRVGRGYQTSGAAWAPDSRSLLLEHRGDIVRYGLGSGTFKRLTSTRAYESSIDWQAIPGESTSNR